MVELKQIPQAPAGVAGIMNYHGEPVPVLDLCAHGLGRPFRSSLSTRILLVDYGGNALGIIAEQATQILRRKEADFVEPGVEVDSAPYLGPVVSDANGVIQRVELDRLLPPSLSDLLFRKEANRP